MTSPTRDVFQLELEKRGVVQAVTNDVTGGIEIQVGGKSVNYYDDSNSLLIVGDSRVHYGYRPCFATPIVSDFKGIAAVFLGLGPNVDTTSAGTLEYRASDKHVRWAAPGDAAGPWTPLVLGSVTVESATAKKWLLLVVRSLFSMPSTDQSVSVTNDGIRYAVRRWNGVVSDVESKLRFPFSRVAYCGVGVANVFDIVEMLPWYKSSSPGAGYCIFRVGTNSLARGDSLADMIAQTTIALDTLLSWGKKIVVIGETAQWFASAGAPLTSTLQGRLRGFNKFLRGYCQTRGEVTRYVDAFAISADPAFLDCRPATGVLVDAVHDSDVGLVHTLGDAIVGALQSLGVTVGPKTEHGVENLFPEGWIIGTAGTAGAGASGEVPTGWTLLRSSGADASATGSIVQRADKLGNFFRIDVANTAASQKILAYIPIKTLAAIGKSVGAKIRASCDIEIEQNGAGGLFTNVEFFLYFNGNSQVRTQVTIPARVGKYCCMTPEIDIPDGTTSVGVYMYINTSANGTPTVKIGDVVVN